MNQQQPKKQKESSSKRDKLISTLIAEMQLAKGLEMEPNRIAIYIRELSDLTEYQIRHAFKIAMRDAKYIPQIAELREWAMQGRPLVDESRAILQRGDKPPGWEPLTATEITELTRMFAKACIWPQDSGTAKPQ